MSSSLTRKVCFNSNCKEASETWRNGWRRRTGEYAHLCDRCALAYEDGKFCETFHINASGWRCCESCGKQIHCGCIVSFHLFVLLDAGGVECLTCAKKSYILTPNPAWPPPSHPERVKDFTIKTWSSAVGSGPGPWHQAPGLLKESSIQSDVPLRMPFEIGLSCGLDVFGNCQRLSTSSEKKNEISDDRLYNGKLRIGPFDKIQNGCIVPNSKELPYFSLNNDRQSIFLKNDSSPNFSMAVSSSSKIELDDAVQLSPTLSQPPTFSNPLGKPVGTQYRTNSSEFQVLNGKVLGDARGHSRLLPRYRPQITDRDLMKISNVASSKPMITPLFEKTLSASDAGRIGRLVLPKKCAEAYFPPIAHPEGLPLKVQDMTGKDWVFQFRFWPNNNSRMYVLEGITPCIQSMHLQAGDIVMFSRMEPEGKLVMGGRKTSNVLLPDQVDATTMKGNNGLNPTLKDNSKYGESIFLNNQTKGRSSCDFALINQVSNTGTGIEFLEDRTVNRYKKKGSIMILKSKRLRFDDDRHLRLTIAEAQRLIRPQAKIVPSVVVVEGYEFEEFEDAMPVVGRPTIPAINDNGEQIQWVQCEDCCKWRKVPADVLLSSRWICSENVWELDVSRCSDLEELAVERLEDVLPSISNDKETTKQEPDLIVAQEGLNSLPNITIREEDKSASASASIGSAHPSHRFGCTCIVCIPSSSGRCHEHAQPCSPSKSTQKILLDASQKVQVSEPTFMKQQWHPLVAQDTETQRGIDVGNSSLNQEDQKQSCLNNLSAKKLSPSPLKGQIDLNIQPERDEESSPIAAESFSGQHKLPDADVTQILVGKQMQQDSANLLGCVAVDDSNPII